MEIHLVPATRENWREAIALKVHPNQELFTPTVAISLAKAYIRPEGEQYNYIPLCIYNGDAHMVGFVMITLNTASNWSYWINGLLIDRSYQGQGYGTAAVQAAIDLIIDRYPSCESILLTVNEHNETARSIYHKFGFAATGDRMDNELIYRLSLTTK